MKVWAFNPAALARFIHRWGVDDVNRMLGELVRFAEDSPVRTFVQPVWPADAIRFRRKGRRIMLGRAVVLRLVEVEE